MKRHNRKHIFALWANADYFDIEWHQGIKGLYNGENFGYFIGYNLIQLPLIERQRKWIEVKDDFINKKGFKIWKWEDK